MGIALSAKAVMRPNASRSFAFRSRSRHLSRKSSTPFADVDQCQHRIGTVGVLRQAAIAYFHKPPNPLEGQKRMFDFGTHSGLSAVGLPIALAPSIATPVWPLFPPTVQPLKSPASNPGFTKILPAAVALAANVNTM